MLGERADGNVVHARTSRFPNAIEVDTAGSFKSNARTVVDVAYLNGLPHLLKAEVIQQHPVGFARQCLAQLADALYFDD